MKTSQVAKMGSKRRFFYWIKERHKIYLKKEGGWEKPWTNDEVLQQYFFTNPYRENDKVTKWVKKHIRDAYARHPNLWFMLCIARQINRPQTLQEMMDRNVWPIKSWRAKRAGDILDSIKERGEPVYTGAYMIRAEAYPHLPWYSWSKQQYMTQIVLGRVWKKRKDFKPRTLQQTCEWLQTFHGWGGFMAYEVVSDLRWTRYLKNAPDIMTWANMGPGAKRGLNRVFDRPLKGPLNQKQAVVEMQQLLYEAQDKLHDLPPLEMREIEHSLCEFDKYERMRLGEGRSKRKYAGV